MAKFEFGTKMDMTDEEWKEMQNNADIPRPKLRCGDKLEVSPKCIRISILTYADGFQEVYLDDYEIGCTGTAKEVAAALTAMEVRA